ncbi:hypothetical protein ACH9EU_05645 [Kocuria sp. M1R5S2]
MKKRTWWPTWCGDEYADYQIQLSYLGYGHRDGNRHGTAVALAAADPRLQ